MENENVALAESVRANFGQRVLTAVIGAPIVILLLTKGGVEGASFFAWVVSSLMLFEFCSMVLGAEGRNQMVWILAANTGFHLLNSWIGPLFFGLPVVILGFILFFLLTLFSVHFSTEHRPTQQLSQNLMGTFFGWMYCGVIPLFVPAIRGVLNGDFWLIFMLIIVWATDIGGYFIGKSMGRHRLYPEVSPKKTWEGALGGTVLSLIVATIVKVLVIPHLGPAAGWFEVTGLTVAVSIFAQVGDLCESVIKRSFNVKDSGHILPGHGGFLDRFDGVLFALPITYAFLWVFHL